MTKKKVDVTIHSSAAEYLTYIAAVGDTAENMEMRYEDENIWLTQKMMAQLYNVSLSTINEHIKKIYGDNELTETATIRKFRIVQIEGSRQVSREVVHYNLQMIIAVGFKVNNDRAVHFRKWSGQIVKDYTIQGWTMDKERLKKGHLFTDEYFERQLQNVREIRLSERKFYQKVTDLYATAFDYDKDAKTTRQFFQTVQNKMHWAVHRHTAAELIVERANAEKEHMGLTTWESAPNGKIVSLYLDYAELQAERQIPMSMEDWAKRLDGFLEFNGNEILTGAGKISAEQAKLYAETEFENYRVVQDRIFMSDYDKFLIEMEEKSK